MFFLYEDQRTTTLHPSMFGPRMKDMLKTKLMHDIEGTCTGNYYIICVLDILDVSKGRIVPGSGLVEFTIFYRAIVCRAFKDQTIDALVTSVNGMGFLTEAGPMKVFVSSQLIPSEIQFDPNAPTPQWTDNADQVIEKGTQIRIKVMGTRVEVGRIRAIGSIKEDFLGTL